MTTIGRQDNRLTRFTRLARRYELREGPGVVGECRDLAREALGDWLGPVDGAREVLVEDVLLLVSEVVTNACRHGGRPYEFRLDGSRGRLWVQVSDTSPVPPRPHGPHVAGRSSGHGLYLLERLSTRWGTLPRRVGKAVWFEVAITGAAAAPGRA
ncbi:ATP-binding protein [Streptomyces sp. NPDC090127]|uniref:ATP-binding protein n=1 Tax=Streptomyces sp. NPDC090127 TaxID=3365953 RepID=UPI0038050D0B